MSKKLMIFMLISIIIIPSISINSLSEKNNWWNESWSFRQSIDIPIDASLTEAKYQPIDIRIKFDNLCWAKSEKEHAIRIIFQKGINHLELESQIYDLEYSDIDYITECSLVFIIPEEASGKEKYYVYYDQEEKIEPDYPDHVQIEETFYRYEPIPGYPYESYCYKIIEEGYIVYAIAQKGEVLGIGTSQQVMKFKPKSEKLIPSNGESVAFFDFWYFFDRGYNDYKSTCQKLVSKEVFVDGNLMINCNIISRSNQEDMQTTANYKYYYSPKDDKRIHVHLEHEVLKEGLIETYDFYDGSYASLQTGGVRSHTIKELNAGEILPYIHIYSEDNIVREFSLYTDPEYSNGEWNIPITTTFDDVDLGNQAWACYDKGITGEAYSLILGSTSVITKGKEERDGIQVQIYETGYPDLPGLENNVASFQLGRNSYEKGTTQDVDFYSTQSGGYESVAREANIFQDLIEIKPKYNKNDTLGDEEIVTYSLKTNVFFAPSFPIGSVLSTLTGKNFSYITGEIYKDGNCIQSNIVGRLSFNQLPELEDEKLIEKMKLFLGVFDFKNFTLFKKVIFPNLPPGNYLIKIYKNNPFMSKDKKYIGYQFVNLTDDTKSNIFCNCEGEIKISIFDQNKNEIENVKVLLLDGDNAIAEGYTDKNGEVTLVAPCKIFKKYNLKMFYKGFLIHKESIKLGLLSSISPVKKTTNIKVYDFKIKIIDAWGLPPDIKLIPFLNSTKMDETENLFGEQISPGLFQFTSLIPEIYSFNLKYKSEELQEPISIPGEKEKTIIFPLEYQIKMKIYDTYGNTIDNIRLEISRGNKITEISGKTLSTLNLPPGVYNINIYDQNDLIGKRGVTVLGDRSVSLVTNSEPIYPLVITICGTLIIFAALYFSFSNRDVKSFLKILVIILLIVSIVYPWWGQSGSTSDIKTSTSLYIQPVGLVTLTSSSDIISGELASLPEVFISAISLISVLTIIGCIILALTIFLDKYRRKNLSLIMMVISFILILTAIMVFVIAMSELANITVEGFIGNGTIETTTIGEGKSEMIPSSWGPNIGFFIYLIAIILLFPATLIKTKSGSPLKK